jgi:hypothetical protein
MAGSGFIEAKRILAFMRGAAGSSTIRLFPMEAPVQQQEAEFLAIVVFILISSIGS